MHTNLPTAAEVRGSLERLSHAQLQLLSRKSLVPFTTLWKIRSGETQNPGIETVAKFIKLVRALEGRL